MDYWIGEVSVKYHVSDIYLQIGQLWEKGRFIIRITQPDEHIAPDGICENVMAKWYSQRSDYPRIYNSRYPDSEFMKAPSDFLISSISTENKHLLSKLVAQSLGSVSNNYSNHESPEHNQRKRIEDYYLTKIWILGELKIESLPNNTLSLFLRLPHEYKAFYSAPDLIED